MCRLQAGAPDARSVAQLWHGLANTNQFCLIGVELQSSVVSQFMEVTGQLQFSELLYIAYRLSS